jgi:hypothetical protein
MMMFAFFPIFTVFFILFCSSALAGIFRRAQATAQGQNAMNRISGKQQGFSSPATKTFDTISHLEAKVFRLAARRHGRLTLSEIIVETELGVKASEELMERMLDGSHVRVEVNEQGIIVYEFPEIMTPPSDEKS